MQTESSKKGSPLGKCSIVFIGTAEAAVFSISHRRGKLSETHGSAWDAVLLFALLFLPASSSLGKIKYGRSIYSSSSHYDRMSSFFHTYFASCVNGICIER